jgi:uncharacterized membrane protein YjjB (DUF3815 family)
MVVVGLGFLVYWLCVQVFGVSVDKAALITALLFIIVGILVGERPWIRRLE